MEKLNPKQEYTWDFLIKERQVIKQLADILDVKQDYLMYQTNFFKGVSLNNKFLAIAELNKVIDRIKEINNANT